MRGLNASESNGGFFIITRKSGRNVPPKEGALTLLDLGEGEAAAILALHRDEATGRRIRSLGFFEGRRVCVIARAQFSGPLLVEDVLSGARVMIARAIAAQIEVAR